MKLEGEITASYYFWEVRGGTSSHKGVYLLFPVLWLFYSTQDQEILLDHLELQPLSTSYQEHALGQMFVAGVSEELFFHSITQEMDVEPGSQGFAGRLLAGLSSPTQRGFEPVQAFLIPLLFSTSNAIIFPDREISEWGRCEVRNWGTQGEVLPRGRTEL